MLSEKTVNVRLSILTVDALVRELRALKGSLSTVTEKRLFGLGARRLLTILRQVINVPAANRVRSRSVERGLLVRGLVTSRLGELRGANLKLRDCALNLLTLSVKVVPLGLCVGREPQPRKLRVNLVQASGDLSQACPKLINGDE